MGPILLMIEILASTYFLWGHLFSYVQLTSLIPDFFQVNDGIRSWFIINMLATLR